MNLFEEQTKLYDSLSGSGVTELHRYGYFGRSNPEAAARYLHRVLSFCENILKVHGIHASVEFADTSSISPGGCTDMKTVVLNAAPFNECRKNLFSIYGGLALHEGGHILYSKKISHKSPLMEYLLGLLEDVRIETLLVEESPGFGCYLKDMRDSVISESIEEARTTSPFLVACTILYKMLRLPSSLTEQEKTLTFGVCPYQEFMKYDGELRTRKDVKEAAEFFCDILSFLCDGDSSRGFDSPPSDQEKKDSMRDLTGTSNERHLKKADSEVDSNNPSDLFSPPGMFSNNLDGDVKTKEQQKENEEERKALQEKSDNEIKKKIREKISELYGEEEWGSLPEVRMQSLESSVNVELKRFINEKYTEVRTDSAFGPERIIAINEPEYRGGYDKRVRKLHKDIALMKSVFRFRFGKSVHRVRDRRTGSMDRGRLCRAEFTDRVKKTRTVSEDTGMSICLLVDGSGSMGLPQHKESRLYKAVSTAVTIQEAAKKQKGIECFTYSHTTFDNGRNCIISRYSDKSVVSLSRGQSNLDSYAIEQVGEEFLKRASYPVKVLLVISDGQPAGDQYGGEPAMKAVRSAVKTLERKGVYTMQIALYKKHSDRMFNHWVEWQSAGDMVGEMRKLLSKLVKKAGRQRQ